MSWRMLVPQMIQAGMDAFKTLAMPTLGETKKGKKKNENAKPVPQTSQTQKLFGDGFFANPLRAML